MKLLIITQKVDINDSNLGFFHLWLEKFSQKLERVYVICQAKGDFHLPENVIVLSLGKETGYSKLKQFLNLSKFLFKYLGGVDGIFIHMCSVYALASFPLAKLFGKKMVLWHAHVKTVFLAKVAGGLASKVLTSSKEGFAVNWGKKIIVTGQGIDTDVFKPAEAKIIPPGMKKVIITIGRIAPTKDLKTLIGAMNILVNQKNIRNIQLKIIGASVEDYERKYFAELKDLVKEEKLEGYINFIGGVPYRETVKFYQQSDVFVNMQKEKGLAKAVLEAMACGAPTVLCTGSYDDLLGDFKNDIIFEAGNPVDLAQKILNCLNFSEAKRKKYSELLRGIVIQNHSLDVLIDKIISAFKS